MFGYVFAHRDSMTEEQLYRYRACYCGCAAACGSAMESWEK